MVEPCHTNWRAEKFLILPHAWKVICTYVADCRIFLARPKTSQFFQLRPNLLTGDFFRVYVPNFNSILERIHITFKFPNSDHFLALDNKLHVHKYDFPSREQFIHGNAVASVFPIILSHWYFEVTSNQFETLQKHSPSIADATVLAQIVQPPSALVRIRGAQPLDPDHADARHLRCFFLLASRSTPNRGLIKRCERLTSTVLRVLHPKQTINTAAVHGSMSITFAPSSVIGAVSLKRFSPPLKPLRPAAHESVRNAQTLTHGKASKKKSALGGVVTLLHYSIEAGRLVYSNLLFVLLYLTTFRALTTTDVTCYNNVVLFIMT